MTNSEAKTVNPGDTIRLEHYQDTPGREIDFPLYKIQNVKVRNVITEKSGHQHFDVGYTLPEGQLPLKSRDTGEIIDGSNTYWMHPSRFELIK